MKKRTWILRGTRFASAAPATSHGAATLSLGHGGDSRFQTDSLAERVETKLFSDIDALLAVGAQDVAFRALTAEATFSVDAISVLT